MLKTDEWDIKLFNHSITPFRFWGCWKCENRKASKTMRMPWILLSRFIFFCDGRFIWLPNIVKEIFSFSHISIATTENQISVKFNTATPYPYMTHHFSFQCDWSYFGWDRIIFYFFIHRPPCNNFDLNPQNMSECTYF